MRAAWNRCVDAPERYGWRAVEAQPIVEHLVLHVPRRGPQPARDATVTLRFGLVTLRPPQHRKAEGLPAGTLGAVQVRDVEPQTDVTPIAWLLLSTVEGHTAAAAIERVTWYACRWGIEVWHRILKSGCRIEARQLGTGERLQRCLPL